MKKPINDQKDLKTSDNKNKAILYTVLEKTEKKCNKKETQNSQRSFETTLDPILQRDSDDLRIVESKWTKLLVLSAFSTTAGTALPAGYALGVMNNPAVHMRKWCNESLIERFDLNLSVEAIDVLWSAIVSIYLIGGAFGSLMAGWTADKYGRKAGNLSCAVLYLIAGICFYFCRSLNSVEILCIGRLIMGFASGLASACLPMYLSEIAPLSIRGTLGACCPAGFTTGVLVGQFIGLENVLGSEEHWHFAMSFFVILVLLYLILYSYYPESPKWLYAIKGDLQTAETELIRLRGTKKTTFVLSELEGMKLEANESEQSSSFKEVLADPKLRLPLTLLFVYIFGQQISGINAIVSYSALIFRKAGFSTAAAERASLGMSILGFTTILLCLVLVTKINRRPLMLFTSFCCFIALFMFGIFLYFIESSDWCVVGCIVAIFAHIMFFHMGVGPIPNFIGSELFEVAPRSTAMAIGSLMIFIGGFISCMSFPTLQNYMGPLIFLPLSTIFLVMFFFTYKYLPETRGRDSVEVALLISKGFKSKVKA